MVSRIIKVSIRVINRSGRLITPTSALIVLDITKSLSNNCLSNYKMFKLCNLWLDGIIININYYFAGTYQRSGEGVSAL